MAQALTTTPVILPDVPDYDDKLDFAPYANTLRDIILDPNTQTPLTIGIFGSWGSGKTSLMRMIERGLKRTAQDRESDQQTYVIWFNAWLYSKEDVLWQALVMQVLAGVRKWHRRDPVAIKRIDELAEYLHRAAGPAELGHLSISAADLLTKEGTGSPQITLTLQHGLDLLDNIAQAHQQGELMAAKALRDQVRRATTILEQERIESLDRFLRQFEKLIRLYVSPHGNLVVFVDDLDRCLPDKAVEVLEAIKLFLSVPGCIFVLGIDRDVVERGIRLRYGELGGMGHRGTLPLVVSAKMIDEGAARYRAFVQDLLEEGENVIDGGRYLEKIVQIPFVLPPISPDAMGSFIARIAPTLPNRECAFVFAKGLEPNPRQVKRAINIFALLWALSQNKPGLASLIKPVRLAKLVVIQQRHADLYDMLREDPGQLVVWERTFRREQDAQGLAAWERRRQVPEMHEEPLPQEVAVYESLPALKSLLTMHPLQDEFADANFVDLTADVVRTYIFLTHTVKETTPPESVPSPHISWGVPKAPAPPGERREVPVEAGMDASKLGVITGMIYDDIDGLLKQVSRESEFSSDQRRVVLEALARSGGEIWAQVASDYARRSELQAALVEPTLVQVSGARSEAQIPWEIVYDHPLPYDSMQQVAIPEESVEVDIECFWGFKHVVERPLASGYEKQAAPSSPQILVQERPVVNLGLDMGSSQFDRVRGIFERWAAEGLIDLAAFDYPADFREALAKRPAHVNVLHGRGGTEGGEIWIGFGKERLTRRLLESWQTRRRDSALFFLDVTAGLGRGNDWWAWLDLFRNLGAGGVVAPMVALQPAWSSDFMTQFMGIFWSGQKAGEALRQARRKFLAETDNPLGLFYAHFGPAAQRLILPGQDEDDGP